MGYCEVCGWNFMPIEDESECSECRDRRLVPGPLPDGHTHWYNDYDQCIYCD
jgi:hypothetical protein